MFANNFASETQKKFPQPALSDLDLNVLGIHLAMLETHLQDASILQLTEALVSKSDQVFVLMHPRDIQNMFNMVTISLSPG